MAKSKPRCRLYLQVTVPHSAQEKAQLLAALSETAPACVLLRDNGSLLENAAIDAVIDLIQGTGAACLLENRIDAAEALGTDGVQIDADMALYASARAALGESANIGVYCGMRRHDAMALAEAGADYVAFGDEAAARGKTDAPESLDGIADIIAWWSEIFVVPSIAFNIETVAEAERLCSLGADFISPPVSIWESDGAIETLRAMDQTIGRIRRPA